MRELFPPVSPKADLDLAGLYAYPDGPWLRANMVSSDDAAGTINAAAKNMSSDAEPAGVALLRAARLRRRGRRGRVRPAERYKLARVQETWRALRSGRTPTPPIAVISARLDLDPDGPLIAAAPPDARTIVITAAQAPQDIRARLEPNADVLVAGDKTVDLKAAVSALAGRGYRRLLAEGGRHLLGQLIQANLVDELCLTIGTLVAGPGPGRNRGRCPDPNPAAAADPDPRPGRRRFPVLPVPQKRPFIPNGPSCVPSGQVSLELTGAAAGRARTRSLQQRRGR